MAGKSSRFPSMRPKWMLTHPMTNKFMVIESISGLNLDFFDKIYFVCLQEHQDKFQFELGLKNELSEIGVDGKSKIVYLNQQTRSQSETVAKAIIQENISGFIFIKDSDGYYECNITEPSNQIAYFDLNDQDNINARNKSYLELDINGYVTNIVEKKVISSKFSAGGYGFSDSNKFIEFYNKLDGLSGECFVSNVIFEMLLSGTRFNGLSVKNYKDWGTIDSWNSYKSQYKCLFVDIDGTLVTNSSTHFPPYIGDGNSLTKNIELLRKLYNSGKVKIILTTSRPEKYREMTVNEMKQKDIPYNQLIMDLPHCKRIVINDFSKSNPYPSCEALNVPRNLDDLQEYLTI